MESKSVHVVDAVFVLGRGIPNGRMTPAQEANINLGVEIYREGLARNLCVSGGYSENGAKFGAHSEAEAMFLYASNMGIEAEILTDSASMDTYQSLVWAAKVMQKNGWKDGYVVADILHAPRVRLLLWKLGIRNLEVIPARWNTRYHWKKAVHDVLWEIMSTLVTILVPRKLINKIRGFSE